MLQVSGFTVTTRRWTCAVWRRCAALRPTSCSTRSAPLRPVCLCISHSLFSLPVSLCLSLEVCSWHQQWDSEIDWSLLAQSHYTQGIQDQTTLTCRVQDSRDTHAVGERDRWTLILERNATAIWSSHTLNQEFFTFDTATVFYSLSIRDEIQENRESLFIYISGKWLNNLMTLNV